MCSFRRQVALPCSVASRGWLKISVRKLGNERTRKRNCKTFGLGVGLDQALMASLAKASAIYGADLRPVRPGKPSTRSPVVKLGQGTGDFIVPGPGAYSPGDKNRPRASEWVMGDRNARKSSVQLAGVSPGPVYMMKSSVEAQTISNRRRRRGLGLARSRGRSRPSRSRPDRARTARA